MTILSSIPLTQRRSLMAVAGAIALWSGLPTMALSNSVALAAGGTARSAPVKNVEDEPPLGSRNIDTALDDILILLAEDEPPLGSRSVFCALSPGLIGDTDVIWSDRPLFLWQGQASRITLTHFDSGEEIWFATPTETETTVQYNDAALQPGTLYSWTITNAAGMSASYLFEVMDANERQALATELAALDAQLNEAGTDPQTAIVEKAHFFAQQGLWSDVLQLLSAVEQPPISLTNALAQISTYVCGEQAQESP